MLLQLPKNTGLATVSISPVTNLPTFRVEQRGTSALTPEAVAAAGVWPAPPALALQPETGAAYVTADRLGTAGAAAEAAWVSVL